MRPCAVPGPTMAEGEAAWLSGGVTLVGGGDVTAGDLDRALSVAPRLIAADGGADRALAHGHVPVRVIGDLDSISEAARRHIPADRVCHIPEQDSTDFTKCLRAVDAPFVMAVGFTGPRLDHMLAVLSAMVAEAAMPVILLAREDVIFLAPRHLRLALWPGCRLSLWPMGPARGRSEGLEWPIDGLDLAPGGRVGTSNRALGEVMLEIEGPMLVLLPPEALAEALAGLGLSRGAGSQVQPPGADPR